MGWFNRVGDPIKYISFIEGFLAYFWIDLVSHAFSKDFLDSNVVFELTKNDEFFEIAKSTQISEAYKKEHSFRLFLKMMR